MYRPTLRPLHNPIRGQIRAFFAGFGFFANRLYSFAYVRFAKNRPGFEIIEFAPQSGLCNGLILITGASSGVGEALARLLSEEGFSLLLTGRDENRLKSVAKLCRAEWLPLDLAHSLAPLLSWIREKKPGLVINNAGFALYGPAIAHPLSSEMDILEVNAAAAIEISIEAARTLQSNRMPGVILNVSSSAGELPIPSMAVYAAAKACLTSFSKSFDSEMSPYGIRVLASILGPVATPFAHRASSGRYTQTPSWKVISPERAAQKIWEQILKRKAVSAIDFRTRAFLLAAKLLPRPLLEWILQKNLARRYNCRSCQK